MKSKNKTWYDLALALFLLIVFAFFLWVAKNPEKAGSHIQVFVNGELVTSYSLKDDGEYIVSTDVGELSFCIKDGKAYVLTSDCHNLDCCRMGSISRQGQSITCLPLRVRLVVLGEGEVDAYV